MYICKYAAKSLQEYVILCCICVINCQQDSVHANSMLMQYEQMMNQHAQYVLLLNQNQKLLNINTLFLHQII